jgi:hypothetical protein
MYQWKHPPFDFEGDDASQSFFYHKSNVIGEAIASKSAVE